MTGLIATLALVFFAVIVLRAGIGDLVTMKIPNKLILTLLVGYAVLVPFAGLSLVQIVLNMMAATAVFWLAFGAFAYGWMGGGDVKLMAVVALWLGLPLVPAFLVWTSVFGGVLTVALLLYRVVPISAAGFGQIAWAGRLHAREARVPYGVAIASAALMVFLSSPWTASLL